MEKNESNRTPFWHRLSKSKAMELFIAGTEIRPNRA